MDEAVELFSPASFRWWISGGRALDLFVGRTWRRHDDLDVGLCRSDATHLVTLLRGWDVRVASRGRLTPWDGGMPDAAADENNLWCRRRGERVWRLDVTISSGDTDAWIFRRDPTLRRPWTEAVRRTPSGVPYLAPHLQLLFKLRDPRPKDTIDAMAVVPHLTDDERALLSSRIDVGHPWSALLS